MGAGAPSQPHDLVSPCLYLMSWWSQMTLRVCSSMKLSRILHLGGALYEWLVQVLLTAIQERLQHRKELEV